MHSVAVGARVRATRSVVLVLIGFGVSACGLRETAGAPPAFTSGIEDRPFNLATDCMPGSQNAHERCVLPVGPPDSANASYIRISSLTNSPDQILWRNRFQDYLVWRSEQQCQAYRLQIISTQNGVNFALNTLVTGAAGVAAIVVPPAANILSGIAAITSGIRGNFNEDLYHRMIAPAIIKQIQMQRHNALEIILQNRRAGDQDATVQTYTLEAALGDAERYHQLCSATVALGNLLGSENRFEDSATGIQVRIRALEAMMTNNSARIVKLTGDKSDPGMIRQLREANLDLARQVSILQRQLLTAPTSSLTGVVANPTSAPQKP